MQIASCLILLRLFIFVESGAEASTPSTKLLHCRQPEGIIESGQNLTVDCELNSSGHNTVCRAKPKMLMCECISKVECKMKSVSSKNRIQHLSVEIYNVTITGIYKISMDTSCGRDVMDEIKINVTSSQTGLNKAPPTEPPVETTNTVIAVVCALVVVIIAVVILGIRCYRRQRTTKTTGQGEYQPTKQIC